MGKGVMEIPAGTGQVKVRFLRKVKELEAVQRRVEERLLQRELQMGPARVQLRGAREALAATQHAIDRVRNELLEYSSPEMRVGAHVLLDCLPAC
jgi:hypothetical protein